MANQYDLFAQELDLSTNVVLKKIMEGVVSGEDPITGEKILTFIRDNPSPYHDEEEPVPSRLSRFRDSSLLTSFLEVYHRMQAQLVAHIAHKIDAKKEYSIDDLISLILEIELLQPLSKPAPSIPIVFLPAKNGKEERALTTLDSIRTQVKRVLILSENKYKETIDLVTSIVYEQDKESGAYYAVAMRRGEKLMPLTPEQVHDLERNGTEYRARV